MSSFDPRTKLVLVLSLSTLAVVFNTPLPLALLLLLTAALLYCSSAAAAGIWRRLRPLIPVLLFLCLIQSIFAPGGQVLIAVHDIPLLTTSGINAGICILLRMSIIIGSAVLLTSVRTRDLLLGLVQWKVPYEIAFMVLLAIRFLPLLATEFQDTVTAVQLRGIDLRAVPLSRKLQLCSSILLPVIAGAINRAQRMAMAMEARGFRAYPQRTYLYHLTFARQDYLLLIACLTVTMGLLFYKIA